MAEEAEGAEANGDARGGADPAAMALALGSASRTEADAFLRNQNSLIDLQKHHLREQFKQLRLSIWQQRTGVLLRVATAFIGLLLAVALAYLIWNAANSNALVIDAFSVPPGLAARGLSGPVVSAKLSDRIAAMQTDTVSLRPRKSYADGVASGLKLEIPETGISLSELDRFLREKLGHDQHIGGELVQTDKSVSLTARVGSDGSATVTGSDTDIDNLVQKLAEQVYRITQPYRYAFWAETHGHADEGIAVLKTLAASGPNSERAWADLALGLGADKVQDSVPLFRRAYALDPNDYLALGDLATSERILGQTEDSARDMAAAVAHSRAHGPEYTELWEGVEHELRAAALLERGDLQEAAEQAALKGEEVARKGVVAARQAYATQAADVLTSLHEARAAHAELAEDRRSAPNSAVPDWLTFQEDLFLYSRLLIAMEEQDWRGALDAGSAMRQLVAQYSGLGLADELLTMFGPLEALALAHDGQFAAAEARLKLTPAECYPCLRARAEVAALQRQDGPADFWFAHAAAIGPSLPFAEYEWGRALLDRGKPDAAIEKLTLANKKGPHFADPLEGWGEALMAKNQSHLALAKFEEANKYAPNWGRLHLKWSEALNYAGRKDEAARQLAQAASLDLTPREKSELAGIKHG